MFGDGTAFRPARFDVQGRVLEDFGYRLQYDFLDSGFGMRAQDDNASAGEDESRDLTARVTVAPIYSGTRLLQIGASFRFHEPNESGAFTRFRDPPRPMSRWCDLSTPMT